MEKTEELYKNKLAKEIKRIMQLEHNKKAYNKFNEIIQRIKPKSCKVKIGWSAGEGIEFTLIFEEGGNKNPFDLFIENIEDKAEIFGFICGLYPEVFHLNPKMSLKTDTHFFIDFKFKRDE